MSDPARNAHAWLSQQIEQLGALRNASTRDPQFKHWRQTTLTFIQRIWPEDPQRSERFRRIPFTPPSSKHDVKTARDFYERGCAEALEYLQGLLQSAGTGGTPAPADSPSDSDTLLAATEESYPMLDLPGEDAENPDDDRTLPVSEVAIPPVPSRGPRQASGPPRISVKGSGGAKKGGMGHEGSKANPLDDILDSVRPGRAAEPPAWPGKPGRGGKKNGGRQRLKDMLGFEHLESRGHRDDRPAEPPPTPPRPEPPVSHSRPAAGGPLRGIPDQTRSPHPGFPAPGEPSPPADRFSPEDYEPHTLDREEPPPRRPTLPRAPDPAGERGPMGPDIIEETPRGLIESEDFEALEDDAPPEAEDSIELLDAEQTEPGALEPEPGEAAPEPDSSSAAAEFVMNSPVFASKGRPVQRGEKPPALHPLSAQSPAASALLALASEVNTMGIPEGHRAWARAALVDLARQIEAGSLSWDALREAVHFLMEFPPLARRVLPLLLPFFEKAA